MSERMSDEQVNAYETWLLAGVCLTLGQQQDLLREAERARAVAEPRDARHARLPRFTDDMPRDGLVAWIETLQDDIEEFKGDIAALEAVVARLREAAAPQTHRSDRPDDAPLFVAAREPELFGER